MDIRNKRDELYAVLSATLAHFQGRENTSEARNDIMMALVRVLGLSVIKILRLDLEVEIKKSLHLFTCVSPSPDRAISVVIKSQDPSVILMAANAGLLANPASVGLVRVEGSHGAVWTWPDVVIVDQVFTTA